MVLLTHSELGLYVINRTYFLMPFFLCFIQSGCSQRYFAIFAIAVTNTEVSVVKMKFTVWGV